MKTVFALIVLVGQSAFANEVQFLSQNQMSESLRGKVTAQLQERCALAFDYTAQLKEVSATVEVVKVDNGVVDTYFTSVFAVNVKLDQYIVDSKEIVVKAAQYAGSNPTPDAYGVVESITSVDGFCQ